MVLQVRNSSPCPWILTDFVLPATPSTPASASHWKPLSSLLSPWKRAATEIELQFALRHLGEDLSRGDTRNAASASLNQLTDQIFSHSFTRDEASFVATIVQCAGAEVAGKVHHFSCPHIIQADVPHQFLNDGIKHVVRILGLGAPVLRETGPTNVITRAGDILRLLTLTLEPLRGSNTPPRIDSQVQDEILPRICSRLDEIKTVLLAEQNRELDKLSTTSKITFLARLLHFVLTIGTAWSPRARDVAQPLTSVLAQLTLVI
jgi:mediator of RNA polymerase II transcription subunit 12